jgi:hypothetical protein
VTEDAKAVFTKPRVGLTRQKCVHEYAAAQDYCVDVGHVADMVAHGRYQFNHRVVKSPPDGPGGNAFSGINGDRMD